MFLLSNCLQHLSAAICRASRKRPMPRLLSCRQQRAKTLTQTLAAEAKMAAAAPQRARMILLPSTRSNASLARPIVDRRCTRAPTRATHGLSIRALSLARSSFSKTPSAAETPPSLYGSDDRRRALAHFARSLSFSWLRISLSSIWLALSSRLLLFHDGN